MKKVQTTDSPQVRDLWEFCQRKGFNGWVDITMTTVLPFYFIVLQYQGRIFVLQALQFSCAFINFCNAILDRFRLVGKCNFCTQPSPRRDNSSLLAVGNWLWSARYIFIFLNILTWISLESSCSNSQKITRQNSTNAAASKTILDHQRLESFQNIRLFILSCKFIYQVVCIEWPIWRFQMLFNSSFFFRSQKLFFCLFS